MVENSNRNRPVGANLRDAIEGFGARVRTAAEARRAARDAASGRPLRVDPMGMEDEGYFAGAPLSGRPAQRPASGRAAVDELRAAQTPRPAAPTARSAPSPAPAPAAAPAARPRSRPVASARRREMSADELNDMVMARIRGQAAPANESAERSRARANIAGAMPGFKKGGRVAAKSKPKSTKKK